MALAYYDQNQSGASGFDKVKSGISRFSGLIFLSLSIALFAMLATFSPDDLPWAATSDSSPTNALGTIGAALSAPLMQIFGRGAFLLPVVFFLWAMRSFFGKSTKHFMGRMLYLIPALPIVAAWSSTHYVVEGWSIVNREGHIVGMGGLFGDSVLLGFISLMPFGLKLSLFIGSLFFAILALIVTLYAAGFHLKEIQVLYAAFRANLRRAYRYCMQFVQTTILAYQNRQRPAVNAAPAAPTAPVNRIISTPQNVAPKSAVIKESTFAKTSLTSKLTGAANLLSALKKPRAIVPQATEPQPQPEAAPDYSNMSLSDRIRAIANKNAEQHQNMLKRRFTNSDGELIETATPQYQNAEEFFGEAPNAEALNTEAPHAEAPIMPKISAPREPIVQTSKMAQPKASQRATRDAQPSFNFEVKEKAFEMPSLTMLANPDNITRHVAPREALEASAKQLESVLEDYGVRGEIVAVRPGPVVTMYELEPTAGMKASRVIGLADDIARSMSALTARVSTVPGRSVIGIELPNEVREMVLLREIFTAKDYGDSRYPLPLALGKDISGEPIVVNLAKMPHLLIAGTTGSGKSVAINTMILSLLYHATPEDVRMIMIDPKMLELSVYDDIPHLLSPVVTDPKKAVVALKWTVGEMEERYRKMSKMGVRNIDGYNARVQEALDKGEGFKRTIQTGFDDITGEPIFETEEYAPEKMPYIVVVVDEMADLMMVAGKEIEACIQRLAQMARASGIHLIMATQRPSVDVITGTIKANFPTRISFQVTSKIDSRTILGEMGAEQLLGQGDMLYMSGGGRVTRVHGPFVSDAEVEEIVNHLKAQGEPVYVSGVIEGNEDDRAADIDAVLGLGNSDSSEDQLYDQAVMIVARDRKCSTSYIQRKLSIGYNKAAKIVERMEEQGVVSEANHVGKREILVPEMH